MLHNNKILKACQKSKNGALNISGNNQFHKSLTIKASARNTTTATVSKIKIFFILDNTQTFKLKLGIQSILIEL